MQTITTVVNLMKAQRTLSAKAIFGLSVLLYFVLNFIPGFGVSYAEAECGGGGSGAGCHVCAAYFDNFNQWWHKDTWNPGNNDRQGGGYHSSTTQSNCHGAGYGFPITHE